MSRLQTIQTHVESRGATPDASPSRPLVERRRHPRVRVEPGLVRVRCRSFEPDGGYVVVHRQRLFGILPLGRAVLEELRDLSRGGLSFETPRKLIEGERVHLSLHIKSWCEPMELVGEVRWIRPVSGDLLYRVGVQFAPFGRKQPNPSEALAALRRLERACVQAAETSAK